MVAIATRSDRLRSDLTWASCGDLARDFVFNHVSNIVDGLLVDAYLLPIFW